MLPLPSDEVRLLRKRLLKPMLSPVLSGEPWKPALSDACRTLDPEVVAACVVSYASRRYPDWADRDPVGLLQDVASAAVADGARFAMDHWPFVHALVRMLDTADRGAVGPLVKRFQDRYRASLTDERSRMPGRMTAQRLPPAAPP